MNEIPVDRLDFLIELWEGSYWFPPFYDKNTKEEKREAVREWLNGNKPLLKARRITIRDITK